MKHRWKIDVSGWNSSPFGLFFLIRPGGFLTKDRWEMVECFETRDKALERHAMLKDLPEYL